MGRPLYSKTLAARDAAATSPQDSLPPLGSPTESLSSTSSSLSTPDNLHFQHALDAPPPEKWSDRYFDPESEEFWTGENCVYEAFLNEDHPTQLIRADGTVGASNPMSHATPDASQGPNTTLTRQEVARRTRDEILRGYAIQDQHNRYEITGGRISVPRPGGGTMRIPYPTVGPTPPHYSAGPDSTPTSPISESYGIHPSPMAVGGDDPARFFSDWERLLRVASAAPVGNAGPVAHTGTIPSRPGPLSLSIPTAPPSASDMGPPTGGSTAAMTVLTPTSPVGRIGTGLGGSRRMRRASAAAANAGWTPSPRVGAGSGAQGYTNPALPASPTTSGPSQAYLSARRPSTRGWNAHTDDVAQLPITMDITPIPVPVPSPANALHRHHTAPAAFMPASPPPPIPVPIAPAPPSASQDSSGDVNPSTPGAGAAGSDTSSPAMSMMFTPSPAASVTPRHYHWEAYAAHRRSSHRRQLPTASLPPMPVSSTAARSGGGGVGSGVVPMSHIVAPLVRIGN